MTRKKPPVIDGRIPRPEERYNLEDKTRRQTLGLDPNLIRILKTADEFDHYPDCKWAIIEYKSRSLRNSVDQLQETADQLTEIQRDIDLAIIVAIKINKAERRIYRKRGNSLYNKLTQTPVRIKVGNHRVEVNIYEIHEIDRQYRKYRRSLERWVSR